MISKRALYQLLLSMCLLISTGTAWAAPALQSVDYNVLNNDQVQANFHFSQPVDNVKSFDTKSPATIVLDVFGATSALPQNTQEVKRGVLSSFTAVAAGNRLRILLNLDKTADYKVTSQGNTLVVTLFAPAPQPQSRQAKNEQFAAAALAGNTKAHSVTGVDFTRNGDQGGQVVIDLSDATMGINVSQQADKIIIDFVDTQLPSRLQRKYDVTDFGTPVQFITATNEAGNTQIVIEASGDFDQTPYQVNNKFIVDVNALSPEEKAKKQEESPTYTGKRLSLNFQDISIRAVLQILADFTGINIVASDSVKGDITLRLNDVPWDEALAIILNTQGLAQKQVGNVLMIAPAEEMAAREKASLENLKEVEELEPLRTELVHLNYAKASDMANLLKADTTSLLSPRGNVSVDERTNTLLIKDVIASIVSARRLIDQLDVPVRQVLIEARIVNVDTTFEQDLGVRWGITKPTHVTGTLEGASAMQQNVIDGNNPLDNIPFAQRLNMNLPATSTTVSQVPSVGIALANLGKGYLLDLELSALQIEGGAQLISSPRLVTANQHPALIESGQEIPYQEATSSGATAVEFKKAVLSLAVTPQITPDNKIIMELKINEDEPNETLEVLGTPAISTREIDTNVLVDNGETIVLGGIYKETESHTIQRIPFLGQIPIVGYLFRNTTKTDNKEELLIFITPKIIQQSPYV